MNIPAELIDDRGVPLAVQRAWPREDGRLIFEATEFGTGRIRAGVIDAAGQPRITGFGHDPALPGLLPAAGAGELLVHRYRRRAVVRSEGRYRKFVGGDKAAAVASAHSSVAAALAGSGLAVPDVVASDAGSVTLSAIPGESLHGLGRAATVASVRRHAVAPDTTAGAGRLTPADPMQGNRRLETWRSAWRLWAVRWPQFVAPAGHSGSGPRRHTAGDEADTVQRWANFTASFDALRVPGYRLDRAVERVTKLLGDGASTACISHRDLHDKQLLVDPEAETVGIIDCDTLALAEPALDLANLLVHLNFRVAQGLLSPDAALIGKEHILDTADALDVPMPRFDAYCAATALRLACVYAFRPPYRAVAQAWFEDVEDTLEQTA